MPTYEYQCKKCAHKFEAFQQITQEPLKSCPVCRGQVARLISSGAGIIFKGSGFYATDHRSKEYKDREKQDAKKTDAACPAPSNNEACKNCPAKNKVESRE